MKVRRDDGAEIDVEWGVEDHSSPDNGWDDPGHGSVVYLTEAEDQNGVDVLDELTDAERDRIELECATAQDEADREPPDDYE